VRLGKINLTTGAISIISPNSVLAGGYSLNAGSTIDPSTGTYYFSNGAQLIGVNIQSGLISSNPELSYTEGMYFDLMRNFGDCKNALRMRQNPLINAIPIVSTLEGLQLFPNPASEYVQLKLKPFNQVVSIVDLMGKTVLTMHSNGNSQLQIPVNHLADGMYIVSVEGVNYSKLVLKH
jgi:hypothetical protein